MGITIVGLGPGDPQSLTVEARAALDQAQQIWVRTRKHPTVSALPAHLQVESFDHLYETSSDFSAIYARIADAIVMQAEAGDVLYAVPGHPLFGETSVSILLDRARQRGIPTRVIAGVSFVDAACSAVGIDPLARGLQIADATDLARQHFPQLDPDRPAVVAQLYSRAVASDCKLTLLVLYPPTHPVTLVDAAGTERQTIATRALGELDWTDGFGLMTTLFVPPLPRPSSLNTLAEIVAHLRAPEGCPWDREQTHRSLRGSLLEETYEVLEALDQEDLSHVREELGDLLLHVLMQTQIACESGEFLLSDVAADISAKLVRRHPHVFGDVKVSGPDQVVANWEKIKESENGGRSKPIESAPRALPALARAQKIARHERMTADAEEIAARASKLSRARDREKALGDMLFALAAYASARHIDAESALRSVTTAKIKASRVGRANK